MHQKKGIAILGSTGTMGRHALEVLESHSDLFDLQVITGNSNSDLLIAQAKKYQPNIVVIVNEDHYEKVSNALYEEDIHVYAGSDALQQVVSGSEIHTVLTAVPGLEALEPTISAIEARKTIALANNETLSIAGELIQNLALKHNARIVPVDKVLSGILQCLTGEHQNEVERVYITAKSSTEPNGRLLLQTGWRIMQARWLFDLRPDQVDILLHPQDAVNALVQFEDGCMKAQWAPMDEVSLIQYALTYPGRLPKSGARFNFLDQSELTFERPNLKDFPNIQLVYDALDAGAGMPCVLFAASEVTSAALLSGKITSQQMVRIHENVMHKVHNTSVSDLDQVNQLYTTARDMVIKML